MKNKSMLYCGLLAITMTNAQRTATCKNVQNTSISNTKHSLKVKNTTNGKSKKEKLEKTSLPTRTAEAIRYKSYVFLH